MNIPTLQDWSAFLGLTGVVGTVLALFVRAVIDRKSVDHEHQWLDEKERRDRSQDTDRATYHQRLTVLVREPLAEFIRTGEWTSDEADLMRTLTALRQRTYEHFLDPEVNQAWERLVRKSLALAARRLMLRIEEAEIRDYNRIRAEWDDACKRSFGPFTMKPEESPRAGPRDAASGGA